MIISEDESVHTIMTENFRETKCAKDSWGSGSENIKNEEFIRTFHPMVSAENSNVPGFEQNLYQTPEEQFGLDYPFGNQGYFIPSEVEGPIRSYPPNNAYKISKQSRGGSGIRHISSHPLVIPPHGVYMPPTATPPGSGGIPGPMCSNEFPQQMQWQELNTNPVLSPPMMHERPRSRTKRAKDAPTGPISRTKFSLEEDAKIMKLRFRDGLGWSVIASEYIPHRSEKGLQVHYSVSLKNQSESYNREWTKEEDEELSKLVSEHQRAMWLVIAKRLGNGDVAPTACYARHRLLVRREEDQLDASVHALKQANRS